MAAQCRGESFWDWSEGEAVKWLRSANTKRKQLVRRCVEEGTFAVPNSMDNHQEAARRIQADWLVTLPRHDPFWRTNQSAVQVPHEQDSMRNRSKVLGELLR
jgi:hypothetical protein